MDLRSVAEAVQLLKDRQESDGLAQTRFFRHQEKAFGSEKPEAWLLGANRCGKSDWLAATVAAFVRFGVLDPGKIRPGMTTTRKRVWVISLTGEMSRTIIQPKLFDNGHRVDSRPPMIPETEIEGWNVTNQTLRLKNGSIIIFKSTEAGVLAFQGADIDLAAFDEVPPEPVYNETTIRVGAGRRLTIRGAATILPPPGQAGGVSWLYKSKAKPWLALGQNEDERNENSPGLDVFTAGIRDNPLILPEEIARLEARFAPGSLEARIRLDGALLPSVSGTQVYPRFNPNYHVVSTLNRYSLIPTLPLCLSVDFNAENGKWLVAQRVGRVFRCLDVITLEESGIASMVHEFRTRYPAHQAELWVYGDATGRKPEGQTATSSFHLIAQHLTGYPVPITFKIPDINPMETDRINAVNLHLAPPSGERLVEIAPGCTELIEDLEDSKYNSKGKIDKKYCRSDAADDLGYLIHFEAPVHRGLSVPSSVRRVRRPSYTSGRKSRAFPAAASNFRSHRERWY